jgi:hypothetical protein
MIDKHNIWRVCFRTILPISIFILINVAIIRSYSVRTKLPHLCLSGRAAIYQEMAIVSCSVETRSD